MHCRWDANYYYDNKNASLAAAHHLPSLVPRQVAASALQACRLRSAKEGAQGLPAAPEEAGAIAARSGKQETTEKKPGKKKVVNDVLLHRSKDNDDEDASEENPSSSEEHKAARRVKMKRTKNKEKHRGRNGSSSSSGDTKAELFPRRRSLGQLGEQNSARCAGVPRGLC